MSEEPIGTSTDEVVQSVDDIPLCLGCGLMSHPVHDQTRLCVECWDRRNWWQGGGPLRVVTGDTYHETPLCPSAKQATEWYYWRDESTMYADLADEMDKCIRCHGYRTFGFDEYVGDEDRQVVIGHA